MIKKLMIGLAGMTVLGLGSVASAAETSQSLQMKLIGAVQAAASANQPVVPAVSATIEASGASSAVVVDALTRLLNQCPSGALLEELRKRAPERIPLWCSEADQAGLRGLRSLTLASLGSATGDTGGGTGLPLPPAGSGASTGSSHQPAP
jgi:hypothetical protein